MEEYNVSEIVYEFEKIDVRTHFKNITFMGPRR